MRLQALVSDMGWTLWAAIQNEISSIDYDFWAWAEQRFARALMDDEGFPALLLQSPGESDVESRVRTYGRR